MRRSVVLGFVVGAATPVVVSGLSMFLIALALGTPGMVRAVAILGSLGAVPSIAATILLGVPLYLAFRRLGIESLAAYAAAGFALSILLAGPLVLNRHGPFGTDNRLFINNGLRWSCLLAGPAATSAFWLVVRPDLANKAAAGIPPDKSGQGAWFSLSATASVAIFGLLWLGLLAASVKDLGVARRAVHWQTSTPLAIEHLTLDPARSPFLVVLLQDYARSHAGRLSYWLAAESRKKDIAPGIVRWRLMAGITFADGAEIVVQMPGGQWLEAAIYGTDAVARDPDPRWSEFAAFLRLAAARTNAVPMFKVPFLPWHGET
jgi:hypothetical protein